MQYTLCRDSIDALRLLGACRRFNGPSHGTHTAELVSIRQDSLGDMKIAKRHGVECVRRVLDTVKGLRGVGMGDCRDGGGVVGGETSLLMPKFGPLSST